MNFDEIKKNIGIFVLAVMIIIVYKTFDSIGIVFGYIGDFLRLLIPIFLALAIAFILHPLCRKIEDFCRKLKIKWVSKHCRGISVTIIFIAAIIVITGFFRILLPTLFKSITDLALQLPNIVGKFSRYLYSLDFDGYTLHTFLDKITFENLLSRFDLDNVKPYMSGIAGFSKALFNIFLSLIISVYILLDRKGFKETCRKVSLLIFPKKGMDVISKYVRHTFNIMHKYVYCQLLEVVIVFVLSLIILLVMGVQYAPILSLFIGVFNLIPYFGAIIACTVTALLTVFTSSLSKGIAVAVALIIMQQIDANIIQPKLVKDTLKVKPFWVICGVSVGGGLFGILGILLAVPFMALVKTIFEDCYDDYYHSKNNTDKTSDNEV